MALTRSENMARILAADTSPERRLRRALWHTGPPIPSPVRHQAHQDRPRVSERARRCVRRWLFLARVPRPLRATPITRWVLVGEAAAECGARPPQTLELEASGWRVCRFWEHEVHEELPAVVDEVERTLKRATPSQRADDWRVASVVPLDENGDYERRLLVSLRSPEKTRQIDQQRHTRKWRVSQDA